MCLLTSIVSLAATFSPDLTFIPVSDSTCEMSKWSQLTISQYYQITLPSHYSRIVSDGKVKITTLILSDKEPCLNSVSDLSVCKNLEGGLDLHLCGRLTLFNLILSQAGLAVGRLHLWKELLLDFKSVWTYFNQNRSGNWLSARGQVRLYSQTLGVWLACQGGKSDFGSCW